LAVSFELNYIVHQLGRKENIEVCNCQVPGGSQSFGGFPDSAGKLIGMGKTRG
jgi:hypothetical protein